MSENYFKEDEGSHEIEGLSCPFCGSSPQATHFLADYGDYKCHQICVECPSGPHRCQVSVMVCQRGPIINREHVKSFIHPCGTDAETLELALSIWNQRAESEGEIETERLAREAKESGD